MKLALVTLAAAASLAGCASSQQTASYAGGFGADTAAAGQCFRRSNIQNHTFADDHTLYLRTAGRAIYRVEVDGACLAGAGFGDPLVMQSPPGSDNICRPMDLDIRIRTPNGGVSPCIVRSLTLLTPEQVAALPKGDRP